MSSPGLGAPVEPITLPVARLPMALPNAHPAGPGLDGPSAHVLLDEQVRAVGATVHLGATGDEPRMVVKHGALALAQPPALDAAHFGGQGLAQALGDPPIALALVDPAEPEGRHQSPDERHPGRPERHAAERGSLYPEDQDPPRGGDGEREREREPVDFEDEPRLEASGVARETLREPDKRHEPHEPHVTPNQRDRKSTRLNSSHGYISY